MRKWLSRQNSKEKLQESEFQNIRQEQERLKQLDHYIAQLNQSSQVVERRPVSKGVCLLLGLCLCLVIGVTLFFVLGGPKKIHSIMSAQYEKKENYLQLEADDESPIANLLGRGMASVIKLRNTDTYWSGKLDYNLVASQDQNFAHFAHKISGNMSKDMISTTLNTTINDTKIGKSTYYTLPDSGDWCYYYPDYKTKPMLADINDNELYKALTAIPEIYDFLSDYYKQLMDTVVNEGDISYKKSEPYTVGSLSENCECYEFTLSSAQYQKMMLDLSYKVLRDERLNEMNDQFKSLIGSFASANVYSGVSPDSDDSSYFRVQVFCQDRQILGRSFSILDENAPITIFCGYLKIDSERSFSCYIQSDLDSEDVEESEEFYESYDEEANITSGIHFDFDCTEFNGTYSGSALFNTGMDRLAVSFSNVILDFNNSLIPIKGTFKVTMGILSIMDAYPNTYLINSFGNKNTHQLSISFFSEDLVNSEPSVYDSTFSYTSSYIRCVGDLDLKIEMQEDTFSPPAKSLDKVLSDGKAIAKAFSSVPIEKYLNKYCHAFNSTTKFTHKQALDIAKNGYLYKPILNLGKLNTCLLGEGSYYDISLDNITKKGSNSTDDDYTDDGSDDQLTINFLGDYQAYLSVDDSIVTDINSGKFKDLKSKVEKYLKKNYPKSKSINMPNEFDFNIYKDYTKIQEVLKTYMNEKVSFNNADTGLFMDTVGNIFTDDQTYMISGRSTMTAKNVKTDSLSERGTNLSVGYDVLYGHLSDIALEIPFSEKLPSEYNDAIAELAHAIDSSHSVKSYKKELSNKIDETDDMYAEVSIGDMQITVSSNPTFAENNATSYYIYINIYNTKTE